MTQLNNLEEAKDYDIRSLRDVVDRARASSRHKYDRWLDIERGLIDSGKAEGLAEYLLKGHQIDGLTIVELADSLSVHSASLRELMIYMRIPRRNFLESSINRYNRKR